MTILVEIKYYTLRSDSTNQTNINVEVLLFDSRSRSSKESIPSISVQEPLDDVFSGNVVEWPNPLGVQDKLLHRFLDFALNIDHCHVIAKNFLIVDKAFMIGALDV